MQKEKIKKNNNIDASPISSVHSSPLIGSKKKHNRHSSITSTTNNTSSKSNSLYKIFPLRVQIKFQGILIS